MRDFFDVIKDDGRPWLILGKGPSSLKITTGQTTDWSGYRIFALNHAIRLWPTAEIFHCIDTEVFDDPRAQACLETCKVLVMPRYPHFKGRPDENRDLKSFINQNPALQIKEKKEQILWYNLNTIGLQIATQHPSMPTRLITVRAQYFSAEAAFDLLAKAGVKKIDTLGVDGGPERARCFDCNGLDNPHKTYDYQFENIAKIVFDYGITWRKL